VSIRTLTCAAGSPLQFDSHGPPDCEWIPIPYILINISRPPYVCYYQLTSTIASNITATNYWKFQAAKYSRACSQITDEEYENFKQQNIQEHARRSQTKNTRNRTMPLAQKCIKCGHVVTWNSDLLDKCPACNDRMWSLTPGNVDPDQRLRHWLGDVYDRPTVGARGSNYYNHGSAYFARRPPTAGAGWFNASHPIPLPLCGNPRHLPAACLLESLVIKVWASSSDNLALCVI
jgi:hypothetical protein